MFPLFVQRFGIENDLLVLLRSWPSRSPAYSFWACVFLRATGDLVPGRACQAAIALLVGCGEWVFAVFTDAMRFALASSSVVDLVPVLGVVCALFSGFVFAALVAAAFRLPGAVFAWCRFAAVGAL